MDVKSGLAFLAVSSRIFDSTEKAVIMMFLITEGAIVTSLSTPRLGRIFQLLVWQLFPMITTAVTHWRAIGDIHVGHRIPSEDPDTVG